VDYFIAKGATINSVTIECAKKNGHTALAKYLEEQRIK
jgi:hypothetical protein